MKARAYLLGLYVLLALAHLIFEGMDHLPGIYATKPLLLICLAVLFVTTTQGLSEPLKIRVLSALFFSWLGDILLMLSSYHPGMDERLFFMLGLGSFLAAHVFYFLGFFEYKKQSGYIQQAWWRGWPIYLFLVFFYSFFWGKLGVLTAPVYLYAAVISLMTLGAWNLKGQVMKSHFRLLLAGAVIFMLSDFLIALNKFQEVIEIPAPRLLIMSTYLLAQLLMVLSISQILNHENKDSMSTDK